MKNFTIYIMMVALMGMALSCTTDQQEDVDATIPTEANLVVSFDHIDGPVCNCWLDCDTQKWYECDKEPPTGCTSERPPARICKD